MLKVVADSPAYVQKCFDVASDVGDNLCNVENDVKRRFYIVAFLLRQYSYVLYFKRVQ